ncbi:MAG: TIGR04295 family B12-binding domain-containing radical SAM protein [Myxococcota bacterium]
MKVALVNPAWSFEGSIYFGCREPHLPLEYGYARALLGQRGHETRIFDAQLGGYGLEQLTATLRDFEPDMVVLTSAPSYLFWRCAPPELRVPIKTARTLRALAPWLVVVGPHASTTPTATLKKLDADVAVLGECEDVLLALAERGPGQISGVDSIAYFEDGDRRGQPRVHGTPHATDMAALPALSWERELVERHGHHHHRFDRPPQGAGAELETSRGCPYRCTFCAKENFRDRYRRRPLATLLEELDQLIHQGVRYVYFVDEIFLPDQALLEALVERDIEFGVQLRIDNWSEPMLALLGKAGCVSIEAGVESVTPEGRSLLAKRCKLSTDELASLLVFAKQHVPFVQANLLELSDPPAEIQRFREHMQARGVWSNQPVPMFPYPGSPSYTQRFGAPDEVAWERAHADYLKQFSAFSDIQEQAPLPLPVLESLA